MTTPPTPSAQILGTGLSGLIGSKVVSTLSNRYQFENLDLSHPTHPTDITNEEQVLKAISASPSSVIIHFAAYTDVSKSWEQRDDKTGVAYMVNVVGTQNIAKAAAQTGKHLIHISTAYVFDGEKETPYTEEDPPHPIEWYGQTKAWAEEAVQNSQASWTILRIDQPFRSDPFPRLDLIHRVIEGLTKGTLPPQFTNHWIGPTFVDDFVNVIDWAVESKTPGIFHASSGEKWTDFDFSVAVKEKLGLPGQVMAGDLNEYLQKSNRPYQRNTALSTEKLKKLLPTPQMSIDQAIGLVQF